MAGPWRVDFFENGGYDCITDAFVVWKGRGRWQIKLDMGDYGQLHSWDKDEISYEQAWQDARTICEALNARDGEQ